MVRKAIIFLPKLEEFSIQIEGNIHLTNTVNKITDNLDINSAEKIIFFKEPDEYDLTNLEVGIMAPGYGSLAKDALVEYFGKEYSNKNLGSRTSRGETATLYGYMSYGRIAKLNKYLLELGKDVVGFLVSLKFGSKVGLIITSWNFVNGIYKAAKNQDVIIYNASVYYDQYAKVRGTIYASAGKNVYGEIAVGEEGSVFEERKTVKDYYYNDVNYLCNLAIDNYLR